MPERNVVIVVRRGDCVNSIAAAHGIGDPRQISDHPANAEVFQNTRRRHGILLPGDVVTVPIRCNEHTIVQDNTHRFRVTMPRTRLRLLIEKPEGGAYANEDVLVHCPGVAKPKKAKTDGDGLLDVPVPATARTVRVDLVSLKRALDVQLGDMDPSDDDRGIKKRLANLNYLSSAEGVSVAEYEAAVARFRKDQRLAEGAIFDDELFDALEGAHGC